jgi:hypothetical protein
VENKRTDTQTWQCHRNFIREKSKGIMLMKIILQRLGCTDIYISCLTPYINITTKLIYYFAHDNAFVIYKNHTVFFEQSPISLYIYIFIYLFCCRGK